LIKHVPVPGTRVHAGHAFGNTLQIGAPMVQMMTGWQAPLSAPMALETAAANCFTIRNDSAQDVVHDLATPEDRLDPTPSVEKIQESLTYLPDFYSALACEAIEASVDQTVCLGRMGLLSGTHTVDATAHRTKYFFGAGYTYGHGLRGREELLEDGAVEDIPEWLYRLVIAPLEKRGVIPCNWIQSVVMNDYRAGSSIVAHVDPPNLFARPILTATFFCPARLVFGASFDPARRTPPAFSQFLGRGSVLLIDGYSANRVTHGIRPEDLLGARRVSLVLRHLLVPMVKAVATAKTSIWELLNLVQGVWCDVSGDRSRVRLYVVQHMVVTVLVASTPTTPALLWPEVAWQNFPAVSAIWNLIPDRGGLICNGGRLRHEGASSRWLHWEFLHAGEPDKDSDGLLPGFRWLRLDGGTL